MTKRRVNPRVRVILLLLAALVASLSGVGIFSAYADTSDWTWASNGGTLLQNRGFHSTTELSDGTVLVVGGLGPKNPDGSYPDVLGTETYKVGENKWKNGAGPLPLPKATMAQHLSDHTTTLLNDGTVLLVGGGDPYVSQVYDPKKDAWRWTADSLWYPRSMGYTATRLRKDGRVLVVGGGPSVCEFFQPPSALFNSGVSLPFERPLTGGGGRDGKADD